MSDIETQGLAAPDGAGRLNGLYFAAWRWHFYAGLYVVPFLIMLCLTGIVMVWFSAINAEYGERLTVVPTPQRQSLAQLQATAVALHPGGVAGQFIAPYTPENPVLFRVDLPEGARMIALDPYSGAVLRNTLNGDTWEEWADQLHGELLQTGPRKPVGDLLVEIAASLALLLVVTGMYLAWPRGGKGLRDMLVPDFGQSGRVFWKSLHRSIGAWVSIVLVMFLLTGLSWAGIWGGKFVQAWNTFPAEKWDAVPLSDVTHASLNTTPKAVVPWTLEQTPMPASGSDAGVAGVPVGKVVDLDSVVALAGQIGFAGRFQLAYPSGETGVWTISQDSMSNDSHNPMADRTVHVDRYTGKILAEVGFADYSLAGKAMAMGVPLHMGLTGLWNAVFNILFCVAVIAVCISGGVMWWLRRPEGQIRLAAPPRPAAVPFSKGAVLVVLALSLLFPVLGLTLLAALTLDLVVLGAVPLLRRVFS